MAPSVLRQQRIEESVSDSLSAMQVEHVMQEFIQVGACKRVQSFKSKTIAEKQQLAEDCKAPWFPTCSQCLCRLNRSYSHVAQALP